MNHFKFAILGTRGIPASYGGFETFAEEVSIRLVKRGVSTLVVGDVNLNYSESNYFGVEVLKTSGTKPGNPLKFYKESLHLAVQWGADFILICGVGGSMLIPFYSNKGHSIAVNPDGLGFKRDKYSWWKKSLFYTQYFVASLIPEYIVCDSLGIEKYYRKHFFRRRNVSVIEYGTYLNPYLDSEINTSTFSAFDLPYKPDQYHLIVSRLEPENNVKVILEGYIKGKRAFPLVVVGNTNTLHSKDLIKYKSDQVHFIGGVYDHKKLQLLRAGSRSYWHGHSVGGTNPSLLEAMGSANLCVCHDNVFNREVIENNGLFFSSRDGVAQIFDRVEKQEFPNYKAGVLKKAQDHYSWERITDLYLDLGLQTRKR